MRILQVVHAFPPQAWAGTELVTLHLAQALRARDHQVTVFTRIEDPEAEEFSLREEQVEGLEVVQVVNNLIHTTAFRLYYDNSFFDELFVRLLDRLRPDIVHFQHLAHLSVGLLSLTAALGYPTVLSLHDFFFPCHLIQLIDTQTRLCPGPERGERCVSCLEGFSTPEEIRRRFSYMEQALQAPDIVISPSAFLAEKMCGYFPFLQERLRVLPLGMKPVPRQGRDRQPGAPLRILYVGILLPHKGAHVLIDAVKGLPAEAIEISLYGATLPFWQSYVDRLQEEARNLPVRFCGVYSHEQLGSILAGHDVLVMPMIWEETFSILTREALMAGVPVVAARRGALPEVVQDGVNGLLFEAENAADLRRCLARLLAEPKLVNRLRSVPLTVKTTEEYAGEVEEVYSQLCALPARVQSLQKTLRERHRLYTALSQACARLQAEAQELSVQNDALHAERDRLGVEKLRIEQERDQALAAVHELRAAVDQREKDLRERDARLAAIYASTTWKLYRSYAAMTDWLVRRPLGKLSRWLGG
jgi:glycosyltransferase involved in cell wall biosynthesis